MNSITGDALTFPELQEDWLLPRMLQDLSLVHLRHAVRCRNTSPPPHQAQTALLPEDEAAGR